ncbi:hypothetical protein TNCV_534791 [Trichonephila clavipes]|nr:hypothetical protein TNCV_534791 [Trichonephila clavipes]
MVRKYKDSTPRCLLPPGQHFANANPIKLVSSFHLNSSGFDKITYFHHGNDLEETFRDDVKSLRDRGKTPGGRVLVLPNHTVSTIDPLHINHIPLKK